MKPITYIFDIDGTLSDCSHRLHYIHGDDKDYDAFYRNSEFDEPIIRTCVTLSVLSCIANIIIITGRPESYRKITETWLDRNLGFCPPLYMRKDGDHRPDYIIKKEIYENFIKDNFGIVLGAFEDRKQCVDMWRGLGLTCFQVADGNY